MKGEQTMKSFVLKGTISEVIDQLHKMIEDSKSNNIISE